jgi:hypothetical protein
MAIVVWCIRFLKIYICYGMVQDGAMVIFIPIVPVAQLVEMGKLENRERKRDEYHDRTHLETYDH